MTQVNNTDVYPATTGMVAEPTTIVRASAKPRFSWSSTFAGIVAALAVLAVLTVLGAATAMSAVDANSQASNFGIGAGIWGGASALIAFFVGGLVAAWAGAGTTSSHGAFQGFMTWALGIVLLGYVLAGGIGAVARTAGNTAAVGAQAAAPAGSKAVNSNGELTPDAKATTQKATDQISDAVNKVEQKMTPQNVSDAAASGAKGAWYTLAGLGVTLLSAVIGGAVGGTTTKYVTRRA